jgi:hypothetical protein
MNTASIRQPRTLSVASMLVAAGAVAISVVAISTDDVGDLPGRLVPVAPVAVEVSRAESPVDIPCKLPVGATSGQC